MGSEQEAQLAVPANGPGLTVTSVTSAMVLLLNKGVAGVLA